MGQEFTDHDECEGNDRDEEAELFMRDGREHCEVERVVVSQIG